jgi:hypothetical protein
MTSNKIPKSKAEIDEYLFGSGAPLDSYFVRRSSVADLVCFVNTDGREFDLLISDDALAESVKTRLIDLGVRIVRVDY